MLTISKPLSAGQAQSYHQKEFTAREQNYWSQRGVVAGEWQGRLAGHLGLAGAVSAEDFAKLSLGDGRSVLLFLLNKWDANEIVVPLARVNLFALTIDCRGHNQFDHLRVVHDGFG